MENIRGGRRSGEVRSRGKETGAGEVPQINKNVWKEAIREDADEEDVGQHDRYERRVHTEKRKGIPIVKRRERGGKRICKRAVAKRVHTAIKVTTNSTSILYGEKGWKKVDGARL